ncbi:MAG TPA: ABC transporter permease, partial [Longimicrobiales bacterium]|nr:ABC transporter permease [Longimicrobiales bacterium]
MAAFSYARDYTVGSGPGAYQVKGLLVSHELFPLLGAEPVLGRTFTAEEDAPGAPATVVIGYEYWRQALGGGPDVLGRTLELSGHPWTVIGVAPPGFTGVGLSKIDVWLPIETAQTLATGGTTWKDGPNARNNWWLMTVARLGDGVTVEAAEEQATALHRNARQEDLERGRWPGLRVSLRRLIAARGEGASPESRVARWLGAVSLIVLLIACANAANLLLARASRRRREVAVRLALGISRRRLVGQRVLEAMVLALAGGALALALARWGGSVVRRALLPDVFFPAAAVDGRVVVFTAAASVLAGLLAGLGPALQSTRADLSRDLSEAGRGASGGRSRTRSALAVGQATLSVVLLVGAGLFVRSLRRVHALDLGLDADRVVLASLEPADDDMESRDQNLLYDDALRRLLALPGVEAAAATSSPFQWGFAGGLEVPGVDSLPRLPGGGPYYYAVTPGYFETLGLEIQLGRDLLESDGPGDPKVAVVSHTMAEGLWPGESPLGRCLLVANGAETCTE